MFKQYCGQVQLLLCLYIVSLKQTFKPYDFQMLNYKSGTGLQDPDL